MLKRLPVLVSSLAPRAPCKSLKDLLSMHKLKPNYSKSVHLQLKNFQCPWQKLLSFLCLFLSLPFDVPLSFSLSLTVRAITSHTAFFGKPLFFLMIWQPVDTEAFQKKFQSLFPQLPQAPVINDTSHSVTDKQHRRGTSVMDGSPEQEINFKKKKKPKRADQDIVRVLLQRPCPRDGLKGTEKVSAWGEGGRGKYEIKTRKRNMYPWRSWHTISHRLLWHCLFLCGALDISQIFTYSRDLWRKWLIPALCEFYFPSGASEKSESRFVCQA